MGPALRKGSDVVRALGAVQAQDYAGAKWALAQRTVGADDAAIERELTDGAILRTHVLRPTWHFVAPEDIRWMLALTAPRVSQAMAYYNRRLELTPAVFRRSHAAIAGALAGGRHLMRAELKTVLERAGVKPATGQRLGHLMMQAELDAVICSGARRGKQFTYALLDERVKPAPALDRDAALRQLSRRYFATRGPATVQDFSWWSGLTVADARRGIAPAGSELEQLSLDGRSYWCGVESAVPNRTSSAHLLPNYDEYFIGFKDRSAIGRRLGGTRPVTGGSALIAHVAAIDGQLIGGWKRVMGAGSVAVELTLLVPITAVERRRFVDIVRRHAAFLGVPTTLRVRPARVR